VQQVKGLVLFLEPKHKVDSPGYIGHDHSGV